MVHQREGMICQGDVVLQGEGAAHQWEEVARQEEGMVYHEEQMMFLALWKQRRTIKQQ